MAVSYVDRTTLAVLAPSVTKALHISETEYGWLNATFSIAYLVATPLAGWWIDRVGARRGLVRSLLVWSVIAALHALAPTLGMLLALRAALGLAEGPGFPGAAQTVQRVLPPEDRARGFGVLFTGSSIGGMIAPPLAALLYWLGGWRVAFLGTAAIGLLWLWPWRVLTGRADVRAALDRAEPAPHARHGWAAFVELVTHPVMLRALLAIFASAPLIGFVLGWGAKYLHGELGVSQADVGLYLWLPPLLFDAGALLFGDLASRHRREDGRPPRGLFAIGIALSACLALLPLTTDPWQAVVVAGISLAGGGAIYTITTADLLARVPDEIVSFAGGVLAGAQSLALIIASPIIGWSVDAHGGYAAVVVVLGLWTIPGSLAWLAWRPTRYEAGSRSTP